MTRRSYPKKGYKMFLRDYDKITLILNSNFSHKKIVKIMDIPQYQNANIEKAYADDREALP